MFRSSYFLTFPRSTLGTVLSLVLILPFVFAGSFATFAHDGVDHDAPVAKGPSLLPRASATGEAFEVVAEISNGDLIIFVDDTYTNAPVADAVVELIGESGSVFAKKVSNGLYVINSFASKPATYYNLILSVDAPAGSDLISMKIDMPNPEQPAGTGAPLLWIVIGQSATALLGLSSLVLLFGFIQARRGRWSPVLALPGGFTLIGSGGRHLIASHCVQRVGPQMLIKAVLRKTGLESAIAKALVKGGGSERHFATYLGLTMRMLFDAGSTIKIERWAQDTSLPIAPPQHYEVNEALAWLEDKGGDHRRAIEEAFIAAGPAPTGMAYFYLLETGGNNSEPQWLIYGTAADGRPIGVECLGSSLPDTESLITQIQALTKRSGHGNACIIFRQYNDPGVAMAIAAAGFHFIVASRPHSHGLAGLTSASVLLQKGDAELRVEYAEVVTDGLRTVACKPASGTNAPKSRMAADWLRFDADFGTLQTNLDSPGDEVVMIFSTFAELQSSEYINHIQADAATGLVAQESLLALFTSSVVRYQVETICNRKIDWPMLTHELNTLIEVELKTDGMQSSIVTEVGGEAGQILAALAGGDEDAPAPRNKLPAPGLQGLSASAAA